MKRSEINKLIKEAEKFFDKFNFKLPPFANWSIKDWEKNKDKTEEIKKCKLGWDITDFGSNDFHKIGLLLFTIRNGIINDKKYIKPYAEKIMIVEPEQVTPLHFHWSKMEDIINRGGGNLIIELYNSAKDESLLKTPVTVVCDGITKKIESGGKICLKPGESITLVQKLYHKFWGEPGKDKVIVGEVSTVNDDSIDNRFYEKCGRFPKIIEDEPPYHLLISDY